MATEGPNTGIAYLLWFFVGLFGAHRFYMKRAPPGVSAEPVSAAARRPTPDAGAGRASAMALGSVAVGRGSRRAESDYPPPVAA